MATDLLLFYISFEGVLIPMFFLIGYYGGRNRKIHAAYQFFIYTLLGSLFLLLGVILLYLESGSSDYQIVSKYSVSLISQYFILLAFFFALAIKIPMVPAHIWLPEAHTEANTAASVILAAILLKLGSYGLLRYCLPIFPQATLIFTPFIITLCAISIIYSSIACLALWDMKKLIAYSSIAHMNTATLAIFTNDSNGINASIFFMISHGIISSGLFFLIGFLYDRYHTRTIKYYRGLVLIKPIFTFFFLIFTLANIAVPGTSGFVCEFMTFLAAFQSSYIVGIISTSAIILAPAYSLWFFHKISYGTISPYFLSLWSDLNRKEFNLMIPLLFFIFYMGLFPNSILSSIQLSSLGLLYPTDFSSSINTLAAFMPTLALLGPKRQRVEDDYPLDGQPGPSRPRLDNDSVGNQDPNPVLNSQDSPTDYPTSLYDNLSAQHDIVLSLYSRISHLSKNQFEVMLASELHKLEQSIKKYSGDAYSDTATAGDFTGDPSALIHNQDLQLSASTKTQFQQLDPSSSSTLDPSTSYSANSGNLASKITNTFDSIKERHSSGELNDTKFETLSQGIDNLCELLNYPIPHYLVENLLKILEILSGLCGSQVPLALSDGRVGTGGPHYPRYKYALA